MDLDRIAEVGRATHGGSDDPDLLDFSANTNPRRPDGVDAVYRAAVETARTYPPDPPERYRQAAADYVGCEPQAVVPTPGGLAAIRLAIRTIVRPGASVVVPFPSFEEYAREVQLAGAEPSFVPYDEVLAIDPGDHALAVVCNPNNPTGDAYDGDQLRAFVAKWRDHGTPVLVDEAFLGFTDRPTLAGTDGVVVARSLTKLFGLPGIRAGFAVAGGPLLAALTAARRPWNVGAPALAVGTFSMGQTGFVEATRDRVGVERGRMREALAERFDVHPSDAPFLLVDVGDRDVGDLVTTVRNRGIAVRDATTFRGLDSHVRVAVREPDENDRLLAVLGDV